MSSAAEAELGALFLNAKEAIYIRRMLHEMGHPQPRTPIQTDNSTAEGVINNKIQPKRTKAMDMRFYWLRCQEAQNQFRFFWRPGGQNLADYWTKHHSAAHHQNMRAEFLTKMDEVHKLREEIACMRGAPQRGGACIEANKEHPAARVCWTDDAALDITRVITRVTCRTDDDARQKSSWTLSRQKLKLAIQQLASITNDARSSAGNSSTRISSHKSL
jgi:hypothetical protein